MNPKIKKDMLKFYKFSIRTSGQFWIIFLPLFLFCEPSTKFRSPSLANQTFSLIDPASPRFIRSQEQTLGVLTFQAKLLLTCEILIWTSDLDISPNEDSPRRILCPNPSKDFQYSISIDNLNPSHTYSFKLALWHPNLPRDSYKFVQITEPYPNNESTSMMVAKINVRQARGELYPLTFISPPQQPALEASFQAPARCSRTSLEISNPFQPVNAAGIESISSQGFATANAIPHPHFPNQWQMKFELLQSNQNWEWVLKNRGEDFRLTTPPPSYLTSFSLQAESNIRIKSQNLRKQVLPINVKIKDKLVMSWQRKNEDSQANIYISFVPITSGIALHCSFPASAGKASIRVAELLQFVGNSYRFTVIYQTMTFHHRNVPRFLPWIIISHDWRHAVLNFI